MCGDQDTDIDANRFVSADAFDLAFFAHVKLGLHGEGHVADFVEKNCSVFGLFEFSQMPSGGAGEGTFFVSEEFGFDEFRGNGGAIQRNKWAGSAGAAFMQSAGDEFLAGAGFAENANSGFAGGHTIHLGHDFLHGRARPDDFMFAELLTQFSIFGFEMLNLRTFSTVSSSFSVETGFPGSRARLVLWRGPPSRYALGRTSSRLAW